MNKTLLLPNTYGRMFSVSSFSIKEFHWSVILRHKNINSSDYFNNRNVESSLWFTNLPSSKKRAIVLNEQKKLNNKNLKPLGKLVIDCKRPEFNHYRGVQHGKFDTIPLASKGWSHRKSRGDHFTILPVNEHPAFLGCENLAISFEEAELSPEIIGKIEKLNIHYPTSVQSKAIPPILQGYSVLVTAETGCGKTLAYLAPIIDNLRLMKTKVKAVPNSPFAVVLLPTRELAVQVGNVAQQLCSDLNVNCHIMLGGKTKSILLNPEALDVDLFVCTPGILYNMLLCKGISLKMCKHFVMDEADTLLDDSFNRMLLRMFRKEKLQFSHLCLNPHKSQLCLISATMPHSLDSILSNVIIRKHLIEISTPFLHKIMPHVTQKFMRVSKKTKSEELLKLMKSNVRNNVPTMVFSNTSKTNIWLNHFLNENGIKSVQINSFMNPEERLEQFERFRDGMVNVCCCTDVTSRGIDSTRVKHVINYEFPRFIADYIHRCGRTGRIGNETDCLITNFISTTTEVPLVQSIEKSVRTSTELEKVNNNISRILKQRVLTATPAKSPKLKNPRGASS